MLTVLTVLLQILALFFLFISGSLLSLEKKESKSVGLWGKGLLIWAFAIFIDIFAFFGEGEVNLAIFGVSRIVLEAAFILFLFKGTLMLLVPSKHAKPIVAVYFIIALAADFTINSLLSGSIWQNAATHRIYVTMPLSIVFFSYFYTYYIKLKKRIVLEMTLGWGALFMSCLLMIIFASFMIDHLSRMALVFEYSIALYIAFAFDRFRKQGDTWHAVTTPKIYIVDSELLDFMNKEFKRDTRPVIESELKKHNASSIHSLDPSQRALFIDNLLNNFPELSTQRRAILKTKVIEMLGLRMDSGNWRTV
ncbi:MAG: hypothetical protein ACOCUR_01525 [Nanoarchaeota archaeon]